MLTFIRYIYAKLKYQRKFKTALQLFQVKDEKSTPYFTWSLDLVYILKLKNTTIISLYKLRKVQQICLPSRLKIKDSVLYGV